MSKHLLTEVFSRIEGKKDELVDFLLEMLNYRSINFQHSGDEKDAQEWFNRKLTEIGFATEMFDVDPDFLKDFPYFVKPQGRKYSDRPNVAGRLHGMGNGRSLVLNGHMDVVPLGDDSKWKHHPWGEIAGNRVYGRGSSDMKGGLAAMYMAVKVLSELGIKLKGDLVFHSVVDEESSGNGTLMCVAKGYTGDAGIVGEGTGLEIQTAHRGVQFLRVITSGLSGHAANRRNLVSAIDKMVLIFNELMICEKNERLVRQHDLLVPPTISVGMFHGGDAPHIVADRCEINCDVKYLPTERSDEVRRIVEQYIDRAVQGDSWLRENPPEIQWLLDADPSEIANDHPVVQTLAKSYNKVTSDHPTFSGLQGCADMRHLIKRGNTPSVLFGPGLMTVAHQADEFIEIDKLVDSVKIYAQFILDWCQSTELEK